MLSILLWIGFGAIAFASVIAICWVVIDASVFEVTGGRERED